MCLKCEKDHINHKKISFSEIISEKYNIDGLKNYINKIKDYINDI